MYIHIYDMCTYIYTYLHVYMYKYIHIYIIYNIIYICNTLTYADECRRMLTNADECWHMQVLGTTSDSMQRSKAFLRRAQAYAEASTLEAVCQYPVKLILFAALSYLCTRPYATNTHTHTQEALDRSTQLPLKALVA